MTRRRGFSLVELVVVMVLSGFLASIGLGMLLAHRRSLEQAIAAVSINANVRILSGFLGLELRGLGRGRTTGPDLLDVDSVSITYRSPSALFTICAVQLDGRMVAVTRGFGVDLPDREVDSIRVYVGRRDASDSGSVWVTAALGSSGPARCPNGSPALAMQLDYGSAWSGRGPVPGAPLRAFRVQRLRFYRASDGRYYLGLSRFKRTRGRFTVTQPVVGPFDKGGLRFRYYDASGSATGDVENVQSIGVEVRLPTMAEGTQSSTYRTSFALRNVVR